MFTKEHVGILETLEEDLEAAGLRWQRLLLAMELAAVPEWIVEGFGSKPYNVGVWNEMCSKLAIEYVGSCFADIREVRNKAAETLAMTLGSRREDDVPGSSKAAREQVSVNPLVPFGVSCGVWFLVLGLKNTDNLAIGISGKVTTRTALRNHTWVNFLPNSTPYAFHDSFKLCSSHDTFLRRSNTLSGHRANTLGRLEDRIVNFKPFLLTLLILPLALETRSNLVCPSLQAGIDGLEIDTGAASGTMAKFGL
jgi:hypothetical protein